MTGRLRSTYKSRQANAPTAVLPPDACSLFAERAAEHIKTGQTFKLFSCGFFLFQFHDHFGVLFLPDGPCPAAVNTVTPDFDKTVRQDVQAKPAQELHPVQCYRFLSGPVPVILCMKVTWWSFSWMMR